MQRIFSVASYGGVIATREGPVDRERRDRVYRRVHNIDARPCVAYARVALNFANRANK